jgi:hypothetical protein
MSQTGQLFPFGRIVATPGTLEALEQAGQSAHELLTRHVSGDWGTLEADDRRENDLSLRAGLRLLSAHHLTTGEKRENHRWTLTRSTCGTFVTAIGTPATTPVRLRTSQTTGPTRQRAGSPVAGCGPCRRHPLDAGAHLGRRETA